MTPLERLFRLEIDFHRRLRSHPCPPDDIGNLHTSYALQNGYEMLLRSTGPVAALDIERLKTRLRPVVDPRDILAASDSVSQLLGMSQRHVMTRALAAGGAFPRLTPLPHPCTIRLRVQDASGPRKG